MVYRYEPAHFQTAYSYRDDNTLPDFDDSRPVIVMDGQCGLCAMTARWMAHADKAGEFGICRSQAELGTALLRHYGIDAQNPKAGSISWMVGLIVRLTVSFAPVHG